MVLLSIFLFIIVAWWAFVSQKYHNFNRFLKPGDPVRFYDCEEKLIGTVNFIDSDTNIVYIDFMDELIPIQKEDVYPVFYFNYSHKTHVK